MSQLYALLTDVKEAIAKAIAARKIERPPSRKRLEYAICPLTIQNQLKPEFTNQNLSQMQTFTKAANAPASNNWIKAITTFIIVMLISNSSFSQYFTESFESEFTPNTSAGPNAPTGWSQTRLGTLTGVPGTPGASGQRDWARQVWSGTAWASNTAPNVNQIPYNLATNGPTGAQAGSGALWFNDGWAAGSGTSGQNLRRIESPAINLSASSTPLVEFYHAYTSGSAGLSLVASNDGGATWATLASYTSVGSWAWTLRTFTLPAAYKVANAKIGFLASNTWGSNDIFIDNVVVREAVPANAAPTAFTTSAITFGSATVGWTDNSTNETAFRVYISTDNTNFTQAGANVASTTTAGTGTTYSANVTGLVANTTYFIRVVALFESESGFLTGSFSTPAGTLSGIKTVGTGGDYNNLATAFAAINASGLSGNIELQLIAGYPVVAEPSPLPSATAAAGAGFTIKVYPTVPGLKIATSGAGGGLDLNSAAKITIDGRVNQTGLKDLEITNSNVGSYAVRFINDAVNNTIQYCTIKGVSTSATSGVIVFAGGVVTGNDNNTIDNCDILGDVTTPVNSVYSLGTSAAVDNSGNTISNSNIANYYSSTLATNGVFLASTGNSGWTINANRFYQTARRTYGTANTHNAISILTGAGYAVNNNIIGFANASGTGFTELIGAGTAIGAGFPGSYAAITGNTTRYIAINAAFTAGGAVSNIQGNTVAGINLYTSSGAATTNGVLCGINVTSGNVNIGTVTGNTIGSTTGLNSIYAASTSAGATVVGIYVTSTNTVAIQNNTIGAVTSSGTTNATASGFTGIDVGSGAANVTISNNTIGNATADNIRTGYLFTSPNLSNTGTLTSATGTSAIVGIRSTATGNAINLSSNTVQGLATSGATTTVGGILASGTLSGTTPSAVASSNIIGTVASGFIRYAVANSGTLTGVSVTNTVATTHTVSGNTFRGIVHTVAGTNTINLITVTGGTAANNVTTASNNDFNALNLNTTGSVTLIAHSYTMAATGSQTFNNNVITTSLQKPAAGGTITGFTSGSSSATGSVSTMTNNNFSNITSNGATAITGITNSDGAGTGATRTVTGNTFNNWTTGTGTITGITMGYFGGVSSVSNNTITNLNGQGTITAMNFNASGNLANPLNISNNTINNLASTGTGGNVSGIISAQTSPVVNISQNTVNTLSSAGASSTVTGITLSGATQTNTFRNKIYDLSSAGATPLVSGIAVSGGTTQNLYNNIIGDLRATNANKTDSTDAIRGISLTGTGATTAINVYYNTIRLSGTGGANFFTSGIFHTASATATTATLTLRNNIIINLCTPSGTGLSSAIRRSSNALNNFGSASNKNLLYAGVPSASNLILFERANAGTGGNKYDVFGPAATAGTYQNLVAPRDGSSITAEAGFDYSAVAGPTQFFQSITGSDPTFLHILAGITTQVESGADVITTPAITNDFDGDVRNVATPDIGADEFAGLSPAPVISNVSVPAPVFCTATQRTITADVVPTNGTLTSVTLNYNNGAPGSVSMTLVSGNQYTGTIPAASPGGSAVTWSITATNSLGLSTTVNGAGYQDEPLTNVPLTVAKSPVGATCSGTPITLTASLPSALTLGAGATTGSSYDAIFYHLFGGNKTQHLIRASELVTLGLPVGNFSSLGINLNSGGVSYAGLTISLATTTNTDMAAGLNNTATFTQVYTAASYSALAGVNTFAFGTGAGSSGSFNWDGTSNIIVQFCWSNNNGGGTSSFAKVDNPGFTACAYYRADSQTPAVLCGQTVATGTLSNRPQFIFPVDGFAPYTVKWNDGTSDISTTPVANAAPTANTTYTFTITRISDGCIKSVQQLATVNPLPAGPTALSPSTQCGTGIPTAAVSGTTNGNYRWYLTQTGGTALAGEQNDQLVAYSISGPTTFWVAITDGTCESVRTSILADVVSPDAVTASADDITLCLGTPLQLTATQTGTNQSYTYSWAANTPTGSGIPTPPLAGGTTTLGLPAAQSVSITPTAIGSYTYTVTAVDGPCNTSSEVVVTVSGLPTVSTSTATPAEVCVGTPVALAATSTVVAAGTVTMGTEALQNTATGTTAAAYPAPFGNYYGGALHQILIPASELQALGLVAGNITSLAFDVVTPATVTLEGFNIGIKTTTLLSLPITLETGFTTVFGPVNYTPSATPGYAANTITFTAPFTWDGTSSLIVQTCFANADFDVNAVFNSSTTTYTSCNVYRADLTTVCSAPGSVNFSYTGKPNLRLGGQVANSLTGTLNWGWDNGATPNNTAAATATPATAGINVYTVTATNPVTGCFATDTVQVNALALPAAPIAAVQSSSQCGTAIPTVAVASGGGNGTFKWYTVPTGGTAVQTGTSTTYTSTIAAATTFYVSEMGTNGCEGPRVQLDVTFTTPDALTLDASSTSICIGSGVTLTANKAPGDYAYVYTWNSSNNTNSGITGSETGSPLTITPLAAGSYTYTVTGTDVDAGCVTTAQATVTVNALPVISTATASLSTICVGQTVALAATSQTIATGSTALGAGASASTAIGTPFYGGWGGTKAQYIYTAAQLQAAGLSAGNITALAFNVTTVGTTYQGFAIGIGNAGTQNVFADATAVGGLTQVYAGPLANNGYLPTVGLNTFTFTSPFNWNGTSNIVVSVCWSNSATSSNPASTVQTDLYTGTNVTAYWAQDLALPSVVCGYALPADGGTRGVSTRRPRTTFFGQIATNLTGTLAWQWNVVNPVPGTAGAAGANLTVTPPVGTTDYQVTATNTTTTCSNTSALVTVVANPLPVAPTATSPVTRCGTGPVSLTATAAGGGDLKWYTAATGGTPVFTGSPYNLASVAADVSYWVSETNTTTGCEGPRTQVDIDITAPPTLAITALGPTSFCLGGSVTLDGLAASQSGYFIGGTPSWVANPSASAGLTDFGANNELATVQPTVAGTYVITVSGFNGPCFNSASIPVTVFPTPTVNTVTATPAVICSGASSILSATSIGVGAGTASVGLGGTESSSTAASFFPGFWGGAKTQYIIRASELTAANILPGAITSLGFETTNSGQTYQGFTVQLGHTAQTAMTTTFIASGLTQVYKGTLADDGFTPAVGPNTLAFGTGAGSQPSFIWNGTDNIVVSICWSRVPSATTATSTTMLVDATGFTSSAYEQSDSETPANMCAKTTADGTGTNRPRFTFGAIVNGDISSTMTWNWVRPVSDPGTSTGNPLTVDPTDPGVNTYSVTATSPQGCVSTPASTVTVTVSPLSAVASSSSGAAVCTGLSTTISVAATGGEPFTYSWSDGTSVVSTDQSFSASPTSETTYTVTVTNTCNNTTTAFVTVGVNPLPTVSINEPSISICEPNTYALTSTTNAASPSYQWIKVPSDISGETGAGYTVTATGFYRVRVTDGVTGCVNTSGQVTVNVNPSPTNVNIAPTSATICNGSSASLTASGGTTGGAATATLGAGANTTTLSTDGTPYRMGNTVGNQFKNQYLFRASELQSAGILPGNITSVALTIAGTGGGTLSNFAIKMGTTAQTTLTSTYVTGLTTVLSLATYPASGTVTTGVQSHTFTTAFNWDGTSNIVLEICAQLATGGLAGTLAGDDVTYAATILNSPTPTACGSATGGGTSTIRPRVTFGYTSLQQPTWLWTPATGLSATNTASVTANPTTTTAYTVRATNSFNCFKEAFVTVTVNPVTVITTNAAPSTQLVGQNTTATPLTVTATGTGTVTYQWFSNTTNSNTGGTPVGTGSSYAPSTTAVGTLYYYAVASSDCGTATSSVVSVEVVNANTNFWVGGGSTNWSTPGNWSLNAVPTTLNDAVIPTGNTPYPVLSAASTAKSLLMQSGTTVSLNGQTLTIVNAVDPTGTGTFIGSATSNLAVGATSTLRFAAGAGGVIKNLTINGGTATLATPLDVTGGSGAINNGTNGTVTVANGATLASGGFLTLKSNASGSARVAQGATTGQWITGDVTVERYIPGNAQRAWRFLSVPTKGLQTIKQSWQEGATPANMNPKPGFGTIITTSLSAYSAAGFDERTSKGSMQFFNQASGAWVDVNSTFSTGNVPKIESVKGYGIYIRGDRTQYASGAVTSTTPTTLRTTGTLYTGDQTAIAIATNKFDLIGNTYVSPIDFLGLTRVNMVNSFYLWDPKLVTGTAPNQALGGYVTFSLANGFVGVPNSSSYGITPRTTIQSGEAFMVQANAGGGSITLRESAKVVGDNINYFRPTTGYEKMKANLYTVDGASEVMADANVSVFDAAFANAVDGDDALKLPNAGENFAIRREGSTLVVEGRQVTTSYDTTSFWMWNLRQGVQYKLELVAENMNVTGRSAYLIDNYPVPSTTQLDLVGGTTNYNFTINGDPMSSTANRFKIVYRQVDPAPVPVTFVSISANKVGNAVKVDWKVAGERNIKTYEIERSADSRGGFAKIAVATATGNSGNDVSYSFTDAEPLSGSNFYRIKSVGIGGEIKYTNIAQVLINAKSAFVIAPNPVEGSVVNLQFRSKLHGRYSLRLMSNSGQTVFTKVVEHAGGNSTQIINLPETIARGAYQLEIISPDKAKEAQTLFINTLK